MKHDGDSRVLLPWEAYVHGAALVLLDGIGLGAGLSPASVSRLREECGKMLAEQVILATKIFALLRLVGHVHRPLRRKRGPWQCIYIHIS